VDMVIRDGYRVVAGGHVDMPRHTVEPMKSSH
jgi:hypothetical protein